MNRKQLERILSAIDSNGMDYAMRYQSDWGDIDDESFKDYLCQYRAAAHLLVKYLDKVDDSLPN